MIQMIAKHEFWAAAGAYWIFSAAVSSLPQPSANSAAAYLWMFRFLHTLAGNVTTVIGRRFPNLTTLISIVLALTLAASSLAACAPRYTVHPGALTTDDSAAYDALLIAQGIIDQAKAAVADGSLPPAAKDPLNTLIQSYNVARTSWLTYRGAIATNVPADQYLNQLTQNLTDLTDAIRAFREKEGQ